MSEMRDGATGKEKEREVDEHRSENLSGIQLVSESDVAAESDDRRNDGKGKRDGGIGGSDHEESSVEFDDIVSQ